MSEVSGAANVSNDIAFNLGFDNLTSLSTNPRMSYMQSHAFAAHDIDIVQFPNRKTIT